MTKKREIYHCPICGNVVEILHEGAALSCCGKQMRQLEENASDGAFEKHVPVLELVDGGCRVRVGASEHPMTADHYIQWIELLTPNEVLRSELHPGDCPEVMFTMCRDAECGLADISARAYCNLHGLWRK